MRFFAAFAALGVLSACEAPMTAESMVSRSNLELCQLYTAYRDTFVPETAQAAFAELERRGALSDRDKQDISDKVIRTGMSEHAAICSWGPYIRVNRSGGTWGLSNQFVLGQFGPYVYSDNGRVTSWQQ